MAPGIIIDEDYWQAKGPSKETILPPAYGVKMVGKMAWDGRQLDPAECTYELTETDIEEIERALRTFKDHCLDGPDIAPNNFPLPSLESKLRVFARNLHSGRGLAVLSGLDPQKYSAEDNALIFLGISSYIGSERGMQDNHGNMMVHVRDAGACGLDKSKSSNKYTPFHSEFYCDVLALHVRAEPLRGGSLHVASSWDIVNALSHSRPDVVEELLSPQWQFESRGKLFPACTRPLLYVHDGKIILNFSRRPLLGTETRGTEDTVGRLTARQSEALQTIQTVAAERSIKIPPKRGNLIFLNNHGLLHARDRFVDDAVHTRHIARLWLRNPALAWDLPAEIRTGNDRVYGENGIKERWNLEPVTLEVFGRDPLVESQGQQSSTSH